MAISLKSATKRTTKPATRKVAQTLATPRAYLSWSQMTLWERDRQKYIERYILGEQSPSNAAMEFGSYVHAALEADNDFDDPMLAHLLMVFPSFECREYEIRTEAAGIPLLGKLDGYEPKHLAIAEFKTGRKWTQQRVDKDDQLTFYDMLHYCRFGRLANVICLYWLPTEIVDGEVKPAGMVQRFDTNRSMVDVLRMISRAAKAWREIGEATEAEYKRLGLTT